MLIDSTSTQLITLRQYSQIKQLLMLTKLVSIVKILTENNQ